jgi:sugar/nucleoside kinase (ribokinase family)
MVVQPGIEFGNKSLREYNHQAGDQLEKALRFANACGALSTTGYGGTAAQPTVRQALELFNE